MTTLTRREQSQRAMQRLRAKRRAADPDREQSILRARELYARGMKCEEIAHQLGPKYNAQWVRHWVIVATKIKSKRQIAAEKKQRRAAREAEKRRQKKEELAEAMLDRSDGRGRVGDLSDSVDRAYWRVCG